MAKCTITKTGLTFCEGMKQTVQPSGGRGTRQQGVEAQTLVNMDDLTYSRTLVVLKSGDHGKRGIVMNYCPFCKGTLYKAAPKKKRA